MCTLDDGHKACYTPVCIPLGGIQTGVARRVQTGTGGRNNASDRDNQGTDDKHPTCRGRPLPGLPKVPGTRGMSKQGHPPDRSRRAPFHRSQPVLWLPCLHPRLPAWSHRAQRASRLPSPLLNRSVLLRHCGHSTASSVTKAMRSEPTFPNRAFSPFQPGPPPSEIRVQSPPAPPCVNRPFALRTVSGYNGDELLKRASHPWQPADATCSRFAKAVLPFVQKACIMGVVQKESHG